jgi:hypothetical protein
MPGQLADLLAQPIQWLRCILPAGGLAAPDGSWVSFGN